MRFGRLGASSACHKNILSGIRSRARVWPFAACVLPRSVVDAVPRGLDLPIRSVGVQGDSRSYRHALVVDHGPTQELIKLEAPALTNRLTDINRVVAACGSKAPLSSLKLFEAYLTKDRLGVLRRADAIVRRFQESTAI